MTEIMKSAGPCQVPNLLFRNRHGDGTGKRLLFVAGLRGDDISGVHALGMFHQKLIQLTENGALPPGGTVDLHPVVHPLGVDGLGRGPSGRGSEVDHAGPALDAVIAAALGAELFVQLAGHESGLQAPPTAYISAQFRAQTLPAARALGLDVIRIQERQPEGSLAARLEKLSVPSVVLRLGEGDMQGPAAKELQRGLLSLCQELDLMPGRVFLAHPPPEPALVYDPEVVELRAEHTGVFLPRALRERDLWENDLIGTVVDPLTGLLVAEVRAPTHCLMLGQRMAGAVRPGVLLAQLAGASED